MRILMYTRGPDTGHERVPKHSDADLDLFWPCRYQIEVAKGYQIETKQDHA